MFSDLEIPIIREREEAHGVSFAKIRHFAEGSKVPGNWPA